MKTPDYSLAAQLAAQAWAVVDAHFSRPDHEMKEAILQSMRAQLPLREPQTDAAAL